jgi:hypothetical protein
MTTCTEHPCEVESVIAHKARKFLPLLALNCLDHRLVLANS